MKNLTDFRKTVETGVDQRLHMYRGGGPKSRFCTHDHPRWSPVTQSLRSRRAEGKIGDCV